MSDQQRIELRDCHAKCVRLEARLDEDREFAAKKLHMELELVKSTDVAALEEQVAELKAALEDEALVIDKLVVYLTRDLRTP